jgi:hypothetical protein
MDASPTVTVSFHSDVGFVGVLFSCSRSFWAAVVKLRGYVTSSARRAALPVWGDSLVGLGPRRVV